MHLAVILGLFALLVSPPPGAAAAMSSAASRYPLALQDSPPASSPQQPSSPEPEPENKPAPSPGPPPGPSEPAQENPPASVTPGPSEANPPLQTEPAPPAEQTTPAETKPKPAPKPAPKPKSAGAHRHAPSARTAHKTTNTSKVARRTQKPKPKTKAQPAAESSVPKKVVKNGGTSDPPIQLSPSLTQQQSSAQKQNVSQLLSTTDANLKKLSGRQMNSTQQDTMTQIEQYVQQAKAASDAGDMERARNLAVKAHLLSEELVKH